jgi:hypothetical protein
MYQVTIVFKNGSKIYFDAQEFDVDLSRLALARHIQYSQVRKLTYKDEEGNDAPIYLNPDEVAGISVVPVTDGTKLGRSRLG